MDIAGEVYETVEISGDGFSGSYSIGCWPDGEPCSVTLSVSGTKKFDVSRSFTIRVVGGLTMSCGAGPDNFCSVSSSFGSISINNAESIDPNSASGLNVDYPDAEGDYTVTLHVANASGPGNATCSAGSTGSFDNPKLYWERFGLCFSEFRDLVSSPKSDVWSSFSFKSSWVKVYKKTSYRYARTATFDSSVLGGYIFDPPVMPDVTDGGWVKQGFADDDEETEFPFKNVQFFHSSGESKVLIDWAKDINENTVYLYEYFGDGGPPVPPPGGGGSGGGGSGGGGSGGGGSGGGGSGGGGSGGGGSGGAVPDDNVVLPPGSDGPGDDGDDGIGGWRNIRCGFRGGVFVIDAGLEDGCSLWFSNLVGEAVSQASAVGGRVWFKCPLNKNPSERKAVIWATSEEGEFLGSATVVVGGISDVFVIKGDKAGAGVVFTPDMKMISGRVVAGLKANEELAVE